MHPLLRHLHPNVLSCCLLVVALVFTGCGTNTFQRKKNADKKAAAKPPSKEEEKDKKSKDPESAVDAPGRSPTDVKFLLSMDYAEAKAISAQSLETASGARIAADSIEVLKKDKQDRPIRIRAKGKVFLETGTEDEAKVLCQELYINNTEAVARGKPILQRGGSIVEGLEDKTVFYVLGQRLRVLGLHRLTNETSMVATMPYLGAWTQGPNPLLPSLTEKSVPAGIRTEMQKAAEAEAVLQKTRLEANKAEAEAAQVLMVKAKPAVDAKETPPSAPAKATPPKSTSAKVKSVPGKETPPPPAAKVAPPKAPPTKVKQVPAKETPPVVAPEKAAPEKKSPKGKKATGASLRP